MVKSLSICHLYHHNMNIYGDTGNVLTLAYRAHARGVTPQVLRCEVGEALPAEVDIIIAGGGQDSGQLLVEKDLQRKQKALQAMLQDGVVMLAICGTYQLFGHRFVTSEQREIKGIGLFNMETKGSAERLIGNVIVDSQFGELVGFENHSGKTALFDDQKALGKVVKGGGNNGRTGEEGAVKQNVFGTYMHGPILPKNPALADELLSRALERKYNASMLAPLEDIEERAAAKIAKTRPR